MHTSPDEEAPPEVPPAPPPEPPRAERVGKDVAFWFCGVERYGRLPSLMVCMTVARERDEAMGWSREAKAAQRAENEQAEEEDRPSRTVIDTYDMDQYGLGCLYAACIGLCWPEVEGKPDWRKFRHNLITYGDAVADWLFMQHPGQAGRVTADIPATGRALAGLMDEAYGSLFVEAADASGFTGRTRESGPATGSNSSTGPA